MATAVSNSETLMKVNGSVAVTPNRRLEPARPSHKAPTSPEDQTGQAQLQPLADDHAEDLAGLSAHGDADTDLVRARRDGVLDEAVDPDGRHQQRNQGEPDQERGLEAPLREEGAKPIFQGRHAVERRMLFHSTHGA